MNKFIKRTMLITSLTTWSFLGNYSAASSLPGMILAGETPSAPVIDGKLDDKCWKNTVEMAPFLHADTQDKKALEQTKVYICYDRKNLYIGFHCVQGCLDPTQNQLPAFKKDSLVNDDNKFFSDDWVIILLQPEIAKNIFYDIFINANGAVNDALCAGADPWMDRDKTWNSKAVAKSFIGNGFWTVECAIPFESLKISPIKNQTLGIQLGRNNCFIKERSLWQPMKSAFHTPDGFGRMIFGGEVPQIRNLDFGGFTRGSNTFSCFVLPPGSNSHMRLESLIEFAQSTPVRNLKDFKISAKTALVSNYALDKDGEFSAQFRVVNPLNLETYYRTPSYHSEVKSRGIKADISSVSAWEIYLNGERMDKQGFLLKGENIIAIKTDGPLKGGLSVGDNFFPLDNTWKYSQSSASNWNEKSFDDAEWKFASAAGREFKEQGYYRKSIALNVSKFWPNWQKGGISIAQNSLQQLFMVPEGIAGRTLKDYSFFLEVPEEFNVLGASSYYKGANYAKGFSVKGSERIERNKKSSIKYHIIADTPIKFDNKLSAYQFVSIVVHLPESNGKTNRTEFYYYMSAENGNIIEVPQKLVVNILSAIKGAQPAKHIIQLWTAQLEVMDNKELMEKLMGFLAEAGFNEIVTTRLLPAGINLRNVGMIGYCPWRIDCKPYLKEHPDHALIDKDDKKWDSCICPSLLLEDSPAWNYVDKCVQDYVKKYNYKHIQWDFEASVWASDLGCFCPRCIAQFRNSAKLSPDIDLNCKNIRSAYRSEWIRFTNMRFAMLAGKFRQSVKKVSPEITFSVYTGYQCDSTKEDYGIDWSMLVDKIDVAMCGYGRCEKELNDTLAAIGKTPLVLGELVYPYMGMRKGCDDEDLNVYPNYASKAILFRRITDGTRGVMIFDLGSLDGRTFYAMAEVSRLVKEYEPLFLARNKDSSLVKVSGIEPQNVVVFKDDKTRLIMVINEESVLRKVVITNQNLGENMRVLDYYSGKDLGHAETINAEIPPHDVAVFIVK